METNPIVTVQEGKLLGKLCSNIRGGYYYSFQGIPYAKPPIGELRFKAPQPPVPWSGIKDATKEGNQCFIRYSTFKCIGSEDCLFLNVYTPQLPSTCNALKPVMVWIHGGAFITGSGNSDVYGPDFLIAEDVVIVTLNYRLGIFGFLSLENVSLGIPGNAGLKDQVMALRWVQSNIKEFGGNPKNVTIFGESAGSACVHYHVLSTMSKGLFHKAIMQSGTAIAFWAKGQHSAKPIAEALKLETTDEVEIFKLLSSMSSEEIATLQQQIPDRLIYSKVRPFAPIVENQSKGAFISKEPMEILISGKFNQVPIMIGYTSRDGMISEIFIKMEKGYFELDDDLQYSVPYIFNFPKDSELSKKYAEKIREFYYGKMKPSLKNVDQFYKLETDTMFLHPIYKTIKSYTPNSLPIYFYRMSVESKLNMFKISNGIEKSGAGHGDDIGYLFKSIATPKIVPQSIEDITLKRFATLWTNFARNGNPNPANKNSLINITWIPVQDEQLHYLDIGENLTVGINPDESRVTFWDSIYDFDLSQSSSKS